MSIEDNWLGHLRALVAQNSRPGDKRSGYRAVADASGLSEEYIYQLVEGKPKVSGAPRYPGTKAAKALAKAFADGRPFDWIDRPLAAQPPRGGALSGHDSSTIQSMPVSINREDDLEIVQFDTGGSMGRGLVLRDQPGVIQSIKVSHEWAQKNVHHVTSIKNLAIVTGFSDSMRPMFNPGDPILVDRGVTTCAFDGVYFFRVGEEGYIKRLQRIPVAGGGVIIRAKSENERYDPFDITKGMDFEVFARVVKAWKGEEF